MILQVREAHVRRIPPADLVLKPFSILDKRWGLLVAGDTKPNPMTVSWGGFGTLWDKPVVTVYVRPSRHTFGLLESGLAFTLNFLPDELRDALSLCGAVSGRDTDKWHASGLERAPSSTIAVPRVAQAELAFECRVVATFDFARECFVDKTINDLYPRRDYHRAFIGEVLAAWET
jgi:flavin reductase (DIM6/NTAB) family NADH-FMN oxidoreductase RutF